VRLSLSELLLQRQVEIRRLATRACAYVGYFDPLVTSLNDEDQRGAWIRLFTELQEAVARDPQTAAAVRESFERLRREKAPDLYRMLWGYSAQGLNNGDARRLVDFLDHDDLDFRVLSFLNLSNITGKSLSYYPEKSRTQRQQAVNRWKKQLDDKKIVPVAAPAAAAPPGRAVPK
jgi:hypothetical protein